MWLSQYLHVRCEAGTLHSHILRVKSKLLPVMTDNTVFTIELSVQLIHTSYMVNHASWTLANAQAENTPVKTAVRPLKSP